MKKQGLYYWINNAKRFISLSVVTIWMDQNSYGEPWLADIIEILEGNGAVINVIGINYSAGNLNEMKCIDDENYNKISTEEDKICNSLNERNKNRDEYVILDNDINKIRSKGKGLDLLNELNQNRKRYEQLDKEYRDHSDEFKSVIENVPKKIEFGKNIVVQRSDPDFYENEIMPYEVEKTKQGFLYGLHAEIKLTRDYQDIKNHPLIKGFTSDKIEHLEIKLPEKTTITYERKIDEKGCLNKTLGATIEPNSPNKESINDILRILADIEKS